MEKPLLSIVSPVYRAEKIVDELVKRIAEEVGKLTTNFEIILVEDGSPDNSWAKIAENCAKYSFVKGIKLSRNFGQHYAITAALQHAQGDYVVLMDCDLQDNPKYITDLYAKAQEGYDIVYTKKEERKHSFFKNITAKMFFWVFNYLADNQNADDKTGSFSLLSHKVVDAFCRIQDYHRHYLMVVRFLGFEHTVIEIVHEKRFEGRSSYNLSKLVSHALNGITSQSDKLLRLSITIGFSFFILALLWAFYLLLGFLIHGALAGYTSLMVALLLSTGLILMSIGVLGIYIGKIFEQVKQRPLYFIDTKLNF